MYSTDRIAIFIILLVLLPILIAVDLLTGSAAISAADMINMFGNENVNGSHNYILFQLRIPRMLTAIIAGIGLSLSGLYMQTMFRNPLAGPYVLGISSGAGLGVAVYLLSSFLLMNLFQLQVNTGSSAGIIISAIAGAGFLFFLILIVSFRLTDTVSLLIVGIMFGSVASSLISIMQFFADSEQVHRYVIWSMGSLTGTTWLHLKYLIPVIVLTVLISIFIIKPADAMLIGDAHAITTGASLKRTKILIILLASISSGAITAFVGPVAFIGMAIPHITRFIFSASTHRILVPGIIIVGAIVMLLCDIISQSPGKLSGLPLNAVTALVGAPVIIILILKNRRLKSTF